MAIEKVLMMNVVGKRTDAERFSKEILHFKDVQLIDTMNEIEAGRFTLPICRENLDELLGFSDLTSGKEIADEKPAFEKIRKLDDLYDGTLKFDIRKASKAKMNLDKALAYESGYEAYVQARFSDLESSYNRLDEISKRLTAYRYLENIDVPVSDMMLMSRFSTILGSVSKENAVRLKKIYDHVSAVVYHVGDDRNGEEVFLIITPRDLDVETQRILKSVGFKPIEDIDRQEQRKPSEIIAAFENEKAELEKQISTRDDVLKRYRENHLSQAQYTYDVLNLFANIQIVEKHMAFSDENFYFSAWVPESKKEAIEKIFKNFSDIIFFFESSEGEVKPPVRLKNNWLFRPFEHLVAMYGTPSSDELDPTPFLAITYMLCFGYMFGDVGQGLVLILGGLFASRKLKISLGDVAVRMGMAAIIFGFIYGSVFGNETLLPALWIRPMQDINTALISAVVMGVMMLIGAYIYNIINCGIRKDLKNGIFGPNGLAGLLLYAGILVFILIKLDYLPASNAFATPVLIFVIVMVVLVLFREPVANIIRKRPLYDEGPGDYYIDAGFGLLEMALSMLSNTVSFIRVGAFALTHAGMFLAFETLSKMVGGGIGGIIIMIIGNIFIIVMEGLIDFIQCLRLQFYELFSKYYSGSGESFVTLEETLKNERL